jgi:hypothetical protein
MIRMMSRVDIAAILLVGEKSLPSRTKRTKEAVPDQSLEGMR